MIAFGIPFLACQSGGKPETHHPRTDIQVIVNATELASAFEARESEALELYDGKHGRIKGVFAKSEPLADGHMAMTFKTSIGTFRPIRCIFDVTSANALNRLVAGDEVTVTGRIVGFAESRYFVTVEECLIEREGQ
jgi:exonuclease VII large subunit